LLRILQKKLKRKVALAQLGDKKAEQEELGQAFMCYARAFVGLKELIVEIKPKLQHDPTLRTKIVDDVIENIHQKMIEINTKAQKLKAELDPNAKETSLEQIIFDYALASGREAAVDEMLKKYKTSEEIYTHALLCLEYLFNDVPKISEYSTLERLITAFTARVTNVHRKENP